MQKHPWNESIWLIGQVELKWFSNAVNCSTLISTLLCDWLICHFLFLHLDGVTGSCCMKYLPSVSISRSLIWPAGKHSTRAGCCGSGRRELARTLSLIHIGTVPPDSNTTVLMLLTLSFSRHMLFYWSITILKTTSYNIHKSRLSDSNDLEERKKGNKAFLTS